MNLVGPLDKKYCDIFYYYALFAVISIAIISASLLYEVYKSGKITWTTVGIFIGMLIAYSILYLQYRLLYNMCISR